PFGYTSKRLKVFTFQPEGPNRVECAGRSAAMLQVYPPRPGTPRSAVGPGSAKVRSVIMSGVPSAWLRALVLPLIVLAWLALVVLGLWVLSHFTRTILLVVLAAVLAFAFTPLANLFARRVPRPVAIG